jgi:methyl-accepting chemotaxis protein
MDRFRGWWRPFCRELRHGTVYFALAMIAVVWVGAGLHLLAVRSQLLELVRQNSANLARAFEWDVVHALRSVDWTIQLLRQRYLQRRDLSDFAGLTRELTNSDGLALQYVIIGPDGVMALSSVAASAAPLDLSDREHFRVHVAATEDRLFVSKPTLGKVTGKWTIQLTRRIVGPDGAFAGVIVASVDPGQFSRFYDAIGVGQNGDVVLFGEDGVVRSRKGLTAEGAGQSITDSDLFRSATSTGEGWFNLPSPIDGLRRMGSFRHVAGFPLVVSVGFEEDEVLAGFQDELIKVGTATAILSVLLLAGIAFSTRNRIMHKTTSDALRAAEQLAASRALELRAGEEREADLRRDVALRHRVQSFNEELVSSIKTFGAMIDGLAGASAVLNAAASQAREGGGNVAAAADRAAHRVAEVASAADQLSHATNEVAEKTRASASIFRKTMADCETSSTAIESLHRAVVEIDSVVGAIRKIAAQTNLLALNATIEAARAGSAGRGFSVVASEVKALANQTAAAIEVIQGQIAAIHEAGNMSINVFQEIREKIAAIETISSGVDATVASHRSAAHEIASTTRATAAETGQVSTSANALAQATDVAGASVADVVRIAGSLSDEASRISAAVDRFSASLRSAQ